MMAAILIFLATLAMVPLAGAQGIPTARPAPSKFYLVLAAATYAAQTADVVTTVRSLDRGATEQDPIARPFAGLPHPAFYAASESWATGVNWLALRLERSPQAWKRRVWWLPQAIQVGSNAAGIAFTETHEVHRSRP